MREGKVGPQECFCVAMLSIVAFAFVKPSYIEGTGNAFWYSTIVSVLLAMALFLLCYASIKLTGKKDLIRAANTASKLLSFIFTIVFCAVLMFCMAQLIGAFMEIMAKYLVIKTQPKDKQFLLLGIFLTTAFISFLGFEAITRSSKLFLIILLISLGMLVTGIMRSFDSAFLFPILGNGAKQIAIYSIERANMFIVVLLLAVMCNTMQGDKFCLRSGLKALIVGGIVVLIVMLSMALLFSYNSLSVFGAPIYSMATMISYGDYYQRLDDLMVFLWLMCSLFAAAFVFYGCANAICKLFDIEDIRPVVLSINLIGYFLTFALSTGNEYFLKANDIVTKYGFVAVAISVVGVFISAVIYKKRGKLNA